MNNDFISKLEISLKSPAFWSLAGIFIYQGLQSIAPSLGQGHFGQLVQIILLVMGMYLHPKEVLTAGSTGMLGSTKIRR